MATVRLEAAGITMAVDVYGSPEHSATLLLHGFTGSAAAMAPLAELLAADGCRVIVPDLIGHARTDAPADEERYSMAAAIEQLILVLDHFEIATVDLAGYSMGGRLALTMAVDRPDRVRSLQLLSASPGLATEAERAARVEADEQLAAGIEAADLEGGGVEVFVDRWIEHPLFATQKQLPATTQHEARQQRLVHSTTGLANSLRGMGTGAMRPLHDDLANLSMPVHWMVGDLDPKFVAIAESIVLRPGWARTVLPNAGHALYLEAAEAVATAMADFRLGAR